MEHPGAPPADGNRLRGGRQVLNFVGPSAMKKLVRSAAAGLVGVVCLMRPASADVTKTAVKDSFLPRGNANQNEGANGILSLHGHDRVVVAFDLSGVNLTGLTRARLVLTIVSPANGWGQGRPVRAHRLLSDWTEGNGWNTGNNIPGTGPGVTWNCATDTDIRNRAANCASTWNGGRFAAATAPAVVHTQGMTGTVAWDVTEDVRAGASFGWVIKKENEDANEEEDLDREDLEDHGENDEEDEDDENDDEDEDEDKDKDKDKDKESQGRGGNVTYVSREQAANPNRSGQTPRLILEGVSTNRPPVAADDSVVTDQAVSVTVNVLANDSDPDNDSLTVMVAQPPTNGATVVNPGKTIAYTPNGGFIGDDSFSYSIHDGRGGSSTATVAVTVRPKAVDAVDDTAMTIAGAPVTIGVVVNDLGTGLIVTAVSDPLHGAAAVHADNSITYTPDGGFIGADGFTYTLIDSLARTDTATVTVTVSPPAPSVNVPPNAFEDSAITFQTVKAQVAVLANDADPDGDPLTVTMAQAPANGASVVNADNTVTYTPNASFSGTEFFSYTVSDGRGGSDTAEVTVRVVADRVPPTIASTVNPPANAAGWHQADVTVSFACVDGESGIASCPAPVSVTTEGEDQQVSGTARDRAGNEATARVSLDVDKTPPTLSLSGPASGRRGQGITVTAAATDALGLNSVEFSVDRSASATRSRAPFEHTFVVPLAAPVSSFVSVEAVASDRAENVAAATPLSIEVLGGGFLLGEAFDDSKGLPLPGVNVIHQGKTVKTDARGRFGLPTEQSTAVVRFERAGYTTVERVAGLSTLAGTVVLDARLTPLGATRTTVGPSGGTLSAGAFQLVIPSGALSAELEFRLTPVSGQGLRAALPLGWSPVGSVEVEPESATFAVPAELRLGGASLTGLSLVLARYDTALHAWVAESVGLTAPSVDAVLSVPASGGGAYAVVVADTGATSPPAAEMGQPLPSAAPVEVSFGLTATSEVSPGATPVSPEAKAIGSVVLFSLVPLPSGKVVSAGVGETFDTFGEGELRPEGFTEELVLYRDPLSVPGGPRGDDKLQATFAVSPSRAFTAEELREGRVHVAVTDAPAFERGVLVGIKGQRVSGEGGAELEVPGGALTETVAVLVRAVDVASLDVTAPGVSFLGAVEMDVGGATLSLPATVSLPAPAGVSGERLLVARLLLVSGQRMLKLVGRALLRDGRLMFSGVDSGGLYAFAQSTEPLTFVRGTVIEGGMPARLSIVESSTAPFADVTSDDGTYRVAAAPRLTTVSARSLVSGNAGVESVSPALGMEEVSGVDIALRPTGPIVTAVTPADTARAVALSPSIRVTFSEPVLGATLSPTSFFVRPSGGAALSGRVVMGISNRSASFLPANSLLSSTSYEIVLTGAIRDGSGNALSPFTSSFTTLDTAVVGFNPDAVRVSFPDASGEVRVEAPPGSFEPGASVLILNNTNGIVTSGEIAPDGSLSLSIRAATTDEIQIRITDSSDRLVVIEKTEYRDGQGAVAIGTRGGKVESADGQFVLEVPEGAIASGTAGVFRLTPLSQADIDRLPLPEGADGERGKGAAVEIATGGVTLQKEAKLSFPIPADAPLDSDFLVVRKVIRDDFTQYEVVDAASKVNGKVQTASFPFLGVLDVGVHLVLWYKEVERLGKRRSPIGVITGIAQETDAHPVEPKTVPLAGVAVLPLKDPGHGDFVAKTGADGRFVLFDLKFGTTTVTVGLQATHIKDDVVRRIEATAFEDPGLGDQFPILGRYQRTGDVLFDFPLTRETEPPQEATIRLFKREGDEEVAVTNGFAAVGEELLIRVTFEVTPGRASLSVNDASLVLESIGVTTLVARFTPTQARGYTLKLEAIDAFLNAFGARKSFLAVATGGGNDQPLSGPPSIVTDLSIPLPGEKGVPLGQVFSVQFTEPVTRVSKASVKLRESGTTLETSLDLIGSGPMGQGPVTASSIITALTMVPRQGLKYGASYELAFTDDIVDTDQPPEKLSSSPDPTLLPFTTFLPERLGEVATEEAPLALATLGDRAFVALPNSGAAGSFGTLVAYDLSQPSEPKRIGPRDSLFVGSMVRQLVVEDGRDAGPDLAGVVSFNPRSGNGGITVFDVSGATSPYPFVGLVTTGLPGVQGAFDAGLALDRGFAYVASGTTGLQVVDLAVAESIFKEHAIDAFTYDVDAGRQLFRKGLGFARESIVQVLGLTEGGRTLSAVSVAVEGPVAYVGSFLSGEPGLLTTVELTPVRQALTNVRLEKAGVGLGYPSRIALMPAGAKTLSVVVGGQGAGPSGGRMAVVDVSDRNAPVVLSVLVLQGSWGQAVSVDPLDQTVFVSTSAGMESYSLAELESPRFLGVLSGSGAVPGDSGIAGALLVNTDGEEGVKLTAIDIVSLIAVDPRVVVTDDVPKAAHAGRFLLGVIPRDFEVATAEVELYSGETLKTRLSGTMVQGLGEAPFNKGLEVPFLDPRMQVVLNRGTEKEQRSPRLGVPFAPLLFGVSPRVRLNLEVDPINETVCLRSVDPLLYRLSLPAKVTISLKVGGTETVVFSELEAPRKDGLAYAISEVALFPPVSGVHEFRIVAELPEDPTVRVERTGELLVEADTHNVLPVGHTFINGVDLLDGHLVASSTDVRIPGRKLGLEVTRTYSSTGSSEEGPLGAGWNLNYLSRLIVTECFYTVVGAEGSGHRFVKEGTSFKAQKGYHTSLVENPDGSFDFFTKERVRYHYLDPERNFDGRPTLEFIEEPNGNRIRILYDAERKIEEVVEERPDGSRGRALRFEYVTVVEKPRVKTITGPLGLRVDYEYDGFANLVKVTRGEKVERYAYSVDLVRDRHNLLLYTDANGNTTEYAYFGENEGFIDFVKEVGQPESVTTGFEYDLSEVSQGRFITRVTDGRGLLTTYRMNPSGSPVSIEEPGGVVTQMEWALDDVVKTREVDANGRVTRYAYDGNGNLTEEVIETEMGEVSSSYQYDTVFNRLRESVDAGGADGVRRKTVYEIDPGNGNVVSMTDAAGNVMRYVYDPENGDLLQEVDKRGFTTEYEYDAFGSVVRVQDALGNAATSVYDLRSRLRSTEDTLGHSSSMGYDELDRVTERRRIDALGSSAEEVVRTAYFPNGEMKTQTNGLGLVTRLVLDGLNRVKERKESGGGLARELVTAMVYDGNSNLIRVIDRLGVVTENTYDELNRLTRVAVGGPFGETKVVSEMGYDALGNKVFETDVQGNRTDFVYDGLYRVKERRLLATPVSHVEAFTYEKVGNTLTARDARGKESRFEYDRLNRLVQKTDPEGNVTRYAYDEEDNRTEEEDLTRGLLMEVEYDALGRPVRKTVTGGGPSSFTYVTTYGYDDFAHSMTVTDPRGFETTTVLDGMDRVHEVRQETGVEELVGRNFYDANGNLVRVLDAEGRETEFVYDGLNRQKEMREELSLVTAMEYDGEGKKVREVNRRGHGRSFGYDNLGRLVETRIQQPVTGGGDLVVAGVEYDDAGRKRMEADARGNRTTYEMDGQGREVKVTDALGKSQTFEYDGVNLTAEVDRRGKRTEFIYDGLNRVVRVKDALSQVEVTEYRDSERKVLETDARGLVRETETDALGRLLSVTRSGVVQERHEYDGVNNRVKSLDSNGNVTEFSYDGANRLIARTDALGTTTSFVYDRAGNLLEEKDGRATGSPFDVKNTYDELNRVISVEDAEGNVTRFEYDGEGNRTSEVEPEGQRTEYEYGELNELLEVRAADTGVFQFRYDSNRNRVEQRDGEGRKVSMEYDALDRMFRMTQDPEGESLVTLHEFDENGNQVRLVDAKAQEVSYVYDELNRETARVFTLTAEDFALFTRTHRIDSIYDANDNLIRVDETRSSGSDPPGAFTTLRTYDALDRLESETDGIGRTLKYGYDRAGNRTSLIDPDNIPTTYLYDSLNRLKSVITEGGTTTYEYSDDGLKQRVVNPNGTSSTYEYDALDRLTNVTHLMGVSPIAAYSYEYSANSNRAKQVERNGGRREETTYDYDGVNRLKTVRYPEGKEVGYEYDRAGNRTREVTSGGASSELRYSYDPINRLRVVADPSGAEVVGFEYDGNGNLAVQREGGVARRYRYDIRDQVGQVEEGTAILGRFGYDAEGRRILKIGDEGIRRYTYDELSVVTESDETNRTVRKYEYGLDQLLSVKDVFSRRSFFHVDGLGSTVSLTGEDGRVRESVFYDAWGVARLRVGSSGNHFGYTGQEEDRETGLVYFRARFYDPRWGRFLTQDSVLGDIADLPSLHRYGYARGNPLVFIDPTGREAEGTVGEWVKFALTTGGEALAGRMERAEQTYGESFDRMNDTFYAIASLGGTAEVESAYAEGRLSRESGSLDVGREYARGVTKGLFNLATLGSGEPIVTALAEGKSVPEALEKGFSGAVRMHLPIDEVNTLMDPNANAVDKVSAVGTGALKVWFGWKVGKAVVKGRAAPSAGGGGRPTAGSAAAVIEEEGAVSSLGKTPPAASNPRFSVGELRTKYRQLEGMGYSREQARSFVQTGQVCFEAGTPVWTREGLKAIEELQVGDVVLSHNVGENRAEYKPVVATFQRWAEELLEVAVVGEERAIGVTPEHPFFTRRARDNLAGGDEDGEAKWVAAKELGSGDLVQRPNGEWAQVAQVRSRGEGGRVYNFTVADNHNYFVGQQGVLVHNECVGGGVGAVRNTTPSPALRGSPYHPDAVAARRAAAREFYEAPAGTAPSRGTRPRPPIRENERASFEDFRARSRVGDQLEGHELLQHAVLKREGLATTRLSTPASRQNPVIAVNRRKHIELNRAQSGLDVANQSALENIAANARILHQAGYSRREIQKLTNKAIEHARRQGLIK